MDTSPGMWAPIIVEHIEENVFKVTNREPVSAKEFDNWRNLIDKNVYNLDFEEWEYPPGTIVRCEWFFSDKGFHLRAIEKVG